MPFIPTTQTVRVDALQDLDGQHCENTLWFFKAGGEWTVEEMTTLGEAINSIFTTSFPALHPSTWLYRGCVVYDQQSETAPAVNVPETPTPGTSLSNGAPNNVAWCVKFVTPVRGRSGRGRNYVMGIPLDIITNNEISPEYADAVITAYNRFLVPDLGLDAALVVVSHYLNGDAREFGNPQLVNAITYSDLTVDSQRRRLPGRGN